MRVTGGYLKGRRLNVPRGIRPTQDKVRSAIFNILRDKIENATFLDLFAGSGSMGIEALSRGAKRVVFVEKSRKALLVLKENLKRCELKSLGYTDMAKEMRPQIVAKDALKVVHHGVEIDGFDIIFADPPYNKGFANRVLNLWFTTTFTTEWNGTKSLRSHPLLILEHSKHEKIPIGTHHTFGDTVITLLFA